MGRLWPSRMWCLRGSAGWRGGPWAGSRRRMISTRCFSGQRGMGRGGGTCRGRRSGSRRGRGGAEKRRTGTGSEIKFRFCRRVSRCSSVASGMGLGECAGRGTWHRDAARLYFRPVHALAVPDTSRSNRPRWRNWQTHHLEVVAPARAWRFKSSPGHFGTARQIPVNTGCWRAVFVRGSIGFEYPPRVTDGF